MPSLPVMSCFWAVHLPIANKKLEHHIAFEILLKYHILCTHFYPRGASSALGNSHDRVSVCLSHAGIVSKRLNVGSRKQLHGIAQGL